MKRYLYISLLILLVASCTKKEDNTPKPIPENPTVEAGKSFIVSPNVGGVNQPNQVYVDLSTGKTTVVRRDSWDLAFYCGDDFRVILNPSLAMSAKPTEYTDITKFVAPDSEILFSDDPKLPSRKEIAKRMIDDPRGILQPQQDYPGTGTAIEGIAANTNENKVYLLNMGNEISTIVPEKGGVNLQGAHRGWMKILISRSGNDYKVQYAKNDAIKATEIKTVTIAKAPAYNFVFLSLTSGKTLQVQPAKKDWDLCFTPSTGWFSTDKEKIKSGFNSATYFPDMVLTNLHGGTKATIFSAKDKSEKKRDEDYAAYTKEKALKIDFTAERYTKQTVIGRNWRDNQGGALVRKELFFLVKDGDNNYFKLKFLTMKNDKGERGYPSFEYELLK